MHTYRFGRKLKLPSTVAIKHELLRMMLQDELKAQASAAKSVEELVAHGLGAAEELNAIEPHAELLPPNREPVSQLIGGPKIRGQVTGVAGAFTQLRNKTLRRVFA